MGHHVILLCQEQQPERIECIDDAYDFRENPDTPVPVFKRDPTEKLTPAEGPGRCTLYRPHIRSLLPVYVYDHYPGFTAKEIPHCSEQEIEGYVEEKPKRTKRKRKKENV